MATFEIHPDGLIYVRGDNATYCDTPENFALDYGAAAPALAGGRVCCDTITPSACFAAAMA